MKKISNLACQTRRRPAWVRHGMSRAEWRAISPFVRALWLALEA